MPYLDIILMGVMLAITSYTDIKEAKIPNLIVFPMALLGLMNTALLYNIDEMVLQIGIVFIGLLIGFILYRFKTMGAGDVKLICAMICIVGWQYALMIICIAMVLGVFYAITKIVCQGIKEKIMIPLAVTCFIAYIIVLGASFYYL